jgi:predicted DCC family thiol-disulfide oxidoreductase YuxK
MSTMSSHLIFFDGECVFCNRMVRFLLQKDRAGHFLFAPLQGVTAKEFFTTPPSLDTLILVEHFKTAKQKQLRFGKAALRICWYLPGGWKLLGLLSFLPSFLADPIYRLIARNRHFFGGKVESVESGVLSSSGRLLP